MAVLFCRRSDKRFLLKRYRFYQTIIDNSESAFDVSTIRSTRQRGCLIKTSKEPWKHGKNLCEK
jgi:hypothetical protein